MGAERQFLTRADVEDAARAGRSIQLGARDVITDEARTRARDLGVTLTRSESAGGGRTSAGGGRAAASTTTDAAALRRAVRAAVVAELGREPAGLDAALDKHVGRP